MLQHQMLDPVLPDGPFGAELLLFGAADVVVVLHMLLAGAADTGHVCAAFATEDFAEQQVIHLRLFMTGGLLVDGQQLLHPVEHLRLHDGRHGIFDGHLVGKIYDAL